MSYKVEATPQFLIQAKKLSKKYVSLKNDLADLSDQLSANPEQGTALGKGCFKSVWPFPLKAKVKVVVQESLPA